MKRHHTTPTSHRGHRPAPVVLAAALLSAGVAAQSDGWRANAEIVARTSSRQAGFNYDEAAVGPYTLPDVLKGNSGRIATPAEWTQHRPAVLELFRQDVYGRSPGRPRQLRFEVVAADPKAMDGAATLQRVAVLSAQSGREHRFEITLFLPNARKEPVPLFLLLNNRPATNADPTRQEKSGFWPAEQVIARGYGIAALQVSDLAPDDKDSYRDGVIRLFEGPSTGPRADDAWMALAAWAWGASRVLDYAEANPRIDATRVAVVGHSRGGKAALWAGAEDERFAMIVSNESGEGGAALSRRNYGETLARITEVFPHWFTRNYARYAGRVAELPVDKHMLLALAAPRALYVASADEDLWADPRGEFLSLSHTSPVYALWGEPGIRADEMPGLERPLIRGKRGYHVRRGTHNLTPYDWDRFMDFGDRVWRSPSSRN